MLILDNVSVSRGGHEILSRISLQFKSGEKTGLTGVNGSGKSTLLKLIAGHLSPSEGKILKPKNYKIGYLAQEMNPAAKHTVLEETYLAFEEILRLEQKIKDLETELKRQESNSVELSETLNTLLYQYKISGGYDYKGKTEIVLKGLGFSKEDFDKPLDTFSGGWRMRIELAKVILQDNDMLLLDEPTNHLDIESILWLEQFLKNYPGSIIVVSHDQRFLDKLTTRTIELRKNGKYWDFPFPYSRFVEHKKDLIDKINRQADNKERQIKQTEKLIEKFRYKATKAKFAQSLIKKLEKENEIEREESRDKTFNLKFEISVNPGKIIFEAENLHKKYGEKTVLENLNFIIARGERIAFVGKNGMGKTTLASILAGKNDYTGLLKTGYHVQIGYFAQDQSGLLNPEQTILQTLEDAATEETRSKVRDTAGAFLFSGDDIYKKVKVLSGGEKNRLALAALLLKPFNVLILDEPTNHLDIPSKKRLKQALQSFDGTLIVVSHDREFLSELTHKTWEFQPGGFKEHLGDVNEFLRQRNLQTLRDLETSERKNNTLKKSKKSDYEKRKTLRKTYNRLKNKLQKIEAEIEYTENKIKEMENTLQNNPAQKTEFFEEYNHTKKQLENLYNEWEKLSLEMENIKL